MDDVMLMDQARSDESQLVTFCLGDEEFGFDIMSVQEIIRQPALSRIPTAPSYVEGIANLRGTVLPIIDTRARFGMPREQDTDRTRVLVVDVEGRRTGLRVDLVRQVTRIQKSQVEAPPAVLQSGVRTSFLSGVVKLDQGKRIILALDPDAICRVEAAAVEKGSKAGADHGFQALGSTSSGEDQSLAQLVSFRLGQGEFALPMERVREILRVERPNEVPNTPPHVLGVLTVRGNILPVIDLRLLLGLVDLATEVETDAEAQSSSYAKWLDEARIANARGAAVTLNGAEALRSWLASFTTSSQTLMGLISAARVANDKLTRGLERLRSMGRELRSEAFDADVAPYADEVLKLMESLRGQIRECIRDDQRLVVVQTSGTLLSLVVDRVKEVMTVPSKLIGPPPSVGDEPPRELQGVVRLDNGKRLIMLINADNLVSQGAPTSMQAEHVTQEKGSGKVGDGSKSSGEQQFVTFRLMDEEYGIPIEDIQEIDRHSRMTKIPRSASWVDGITNLRGEVIPVINARKRFGLENKEADERTRVMIIDVAGKKTGLLVDSVREVLSLAVKDIAPAPDTVSGGIDRDYISGIGKVDGGKRIVVLLNVASVVTAEA